MPAALMNGIEWIPEAGGGGQFRIEDPDGD
jgi:hypothetical protein